jgi:hypothetical protein
MSTRTSTVYKYVKEHYPMAKDHRVAREHQVDNPCFILSARHLGRNGWEAGAHAFTGTLGKCEEKREQT